jgi:hypothetical protein
VSSKVYPTPGRETFLVCDDIRREVGRKVSLMGVYFGETINVALSGSSKQTIPVSFVFVFHDGEGTFNAKLKVTRPDGSVMAEQEFDNTEKQSDRTMTFILTQGALPTEVGTYTVRFELDERVYERSFRIVIGDPPPELDADE